VTDAIRRYPAARRELPYKTVLFRTEKQPTSIAIGWSAPVPGRELHPLKSSTSSRRTCYRDVTTLDLYGMIAGGEHNLSIGPTFECQASLVQQLPVLASSQNVRVNIVHSYGTGCTDRSLCIQGRVRAN
jgi:hypothetical protein